MSTGQNGRQAIVRVLQSWLGRNEADGSYRLIIDTYNQGLAAAVKRWGTRNCRMDYSWPWCACCVSAAAMAAGVADIVPVEISCYHLIEIAKRNGIWQEHDDYRPAAGDLILYDWDDNGVGDNAGGADHVGCVESVNGNTMTVIEGNASNKVLRRTMSINGRYIRGFIVPQYGEQETAPEVTPEPVQEPATTERTMLRKGAKGADVKRMQELLIKAGEDCGPDGADGDFGKNTYAAVLSFQQKRGLEVDGIVGPKTWAALEQTTAQETAPTQQTETQAETTGSIRAGDLVRIKDGAKYWSGSVVPSWVRSRRWYVLQVDGERAVINKSEDGRYAICSPISVNYLEK